MCKPREEQRKPVLDEGKKIDFFPQWKPQQGVVEETEKEEEYLSVGEDGRPYIALRKKQEIGQEQRKPILDEEEKVDFFPQWKSKQGVVEETEEEEGYLSVGKDGRPYIALRKKQEIGREEQRKPVLDKEKKVDFFPK